MTDGVDSERQEKIEGIAALATTYAEIGATDEQLEAALRRDMAHLGVATREDALLIAAEIQRVPQPEDQSAEERERRRPIESMLGVTPPEKQLTAQLQARELILRIADSP